MAELEALPIGQVEAGANRKRAAWALAVVLGRASQDNAVVPDRVGVPRRLLAAVTAGEDRKEIHLVAREASAVDGATKVIPTVEDEDRRLRDRVRGVVLPIVAQGS